MTKTQIYKTATHHIILFFLTAIVIIIVSFVLLSPRIASALFPFKRETLLNSYIQTVQVTKNVDPKTFWEFREFYSPGSLTYSIDGVSDVEKTLSTINIPIQKEKIILPFATFTSSKVTSIDSLTDASALDDVLRHTIKSQNILYKSPNALMYTEDKIVKIIFILPESEMRKVIWFFESEENDSVVKGKNWLNITSITR